MDRSFDGLQTIESEWPLPCPDGKTCYDDFYERMCAVSVNHVCVSCACIDHSPTAGTTVAIDVELLRPLRIESYEVPFPFLCGVECLDSESIMIDKLGLSESHGGRHNMYLCTSCHKCLKIEQLPPDALANHRWLGGQSPDFRPPQLRDMSWIDSIIIARGHISGNIVRLQKSGGAAGSTYFGIKGHVVIVPQDTTRLLDVLPLPPSSLPDHVRVVWTGVASETPQRHQLKHLFTVNTEQIRAALYWLKANHRDYCGVTIDEEELNRWNPVFMTEELLGSIGHVSMSTVEDCARAGFSTTSEDLNFEDHAFASSGIVDVNCVSVSSTATTLERLAELTENHTIHIVMGNRIKQDFGEPSYFPSAFPDLFPYGTGGFLDDRRRKPLSKARWQSLLLRHSSRLKVHSDVADPCLDCSNRIRRSSSCYLTWSGVARHSLRGTSTLTTGTGTR